MNQRIIKGVLDLTIPVFIVLCSITALRTTAADKNVNLTNIEKIYSKETAYSNNVTKPSTENASIKETTPGTTKDASITEITPETTEDASITETTPGTTEDASITETTPGTSEDASITEITPGTTEDASITETTPGTTEDASSTETTLGNLITPHTDKCLEICGVKHGESEGEVICEGDDPSGDVTCKCTNSKKAFDKAQKKCETDKCQEICGVKHGESEREVICERDDPSGDVTCKCLDLRMAFDKEEKSCKIPDDVCKEVCGFPINDDSDVRCVLEQGKGIQCSCKDIKKEFVDKDRGCQVNKCKTSCGVDSYAKSDVLCVGDPYGHENVSCECKGKEKEFLKTSKSCIVNKCRRECGPEWRKASSGVVCSGDPFGKATVSCSCRGDDMEFIQKEKKCKSVKGLSNLAIAGIVFISIFCTVMATVAVMYHARRRSALRGTSHYTMRYHDQSITFESALYDATNDTLAFEANK